MIKTTVALAALSLACGASLVTPASAWHLADKRACMRYAHAPRCAPGSVAICVARRNCAVEPHRTLRVCAQWSCRGRR